MYHSIIHGLVIRDSTHLRTRSPHRRAGLTKLQDGDAPSCMRQPSLSPFTYEGFGVSATPVPHTTARACMGRVGVNTERDDSANTENKALHGACGVGRATQSTNEPSKADIRGVGTYAQSSQLLKSSGFDSVFCVSSSKVGAGMQGDQPTHALVGVARMIYGKKDNQIAEKLKLQGDEFLKSIAWKELRRAVVKTYGRKCMRCGHTPKDPRKTNVDHIRPRKTHSELALSFDNLQVLCSHCNKSKGNKWVKDYRSNPWQNYV